MERSLYGFFKYVQCFYCLHIQQKGQRDAPIFCPKCKRKNKAQEIEFYIIVQYQLQKYCTKSMNHKDSISNF
jgi:hypothetical protein